ncbi:hypothetical protein [Tolypothrix sp. VBCCA 56010]|uniref:hypothetical protein n=1 Tax=Tolypothrix sp. VBCCA 56010 TaxID=3137731 RepID=UPI003D7E45E5
MGHRAWGIEIRLASFYSHCPLPIAHCPLPNSPNLKPCLTTSPNNRRVGYFMLKGVCHNY